MERTNYDEKAAVLSEGLLMAYWQALELRFEAKRLGMWTEEAQSAWENLNSAYCNGICAVAEKNYPEGQAALDNLNRNMAYLPQEAAR